MKNLFTLILLFVNSIFLNSQTTIFSENFGIPSVTTSFNSYTGYQNSVPIYFSGLGDVRNTLPSNVYPNASGGGNAYFSASSTNKNLVISGINTSGYSQTILTFGINKSTSLGMSLKVEYSTDSITWNNLNVIAIPSTSWLSAISSDTLPAVPNLRLRFTNPNTSLIAYRIDDIKITGIVGNTNFCNLTPVFTDSIFSTNCPSNTLVLDSVISYPTLPPNVVLTFHTNIIANDSNKLASSNVSPGIYYVAFHDTANLCYSNTFKITVLSTNCNLITIYKENFGIPIGTTSAILYNTGTFPAKYEQNLPVYYSSNLNTNGTTAATIRTTGASSGYSNASGFGNCFFQTLSPLAYLIVSNINTFNYTNLELSFGLYKSSTLATKLLNVEYSTDSITWTNMSYPSFVGTNWQNVTSTTLLPSDSNLYLKFSQFDTTSQFRIDDIMIKGEMINCSNYTVSIVEVSDGGALNDITLKAVASDTLQSYTLLWNTGDTTEVINNKTTGLYIVTITYSNGCIDTAYLQVQDSVSGTLNCSNYTVSIAEVSDGGALNDITLKAVASDTLQSYTLLWNTGDTTEFINNKTTGLYIVTVTYSNGCIDTAYLQVQDSVSGTLNCSNYTVSIAEVSDGGTLNDITLKAEASDTLQSYTLLWNTGDTTEFINNKTTGVYIVTITYSNGCIDTAYLQVQDSVSGTLNCSNYTVSIAEVSDGGTLNDIILKAEASDTLQSYTLLWNTGDTTEVINNKTTGLYIVTVTYSNGCIDTAYLQVQDSVSGTLNCSNYTVSIAEVSDGGTLNDITLKAVASDTLQSYTLLWNTGDTTEVINNKTTGLYIVTVTYSNGCIDTAYLQVQDSVSGTLNCSNYTVSITEVSDGGTLNDITLKAVASDTLQGYTLQWNTGDTTEVINNKTTGVYLVTITYSNGCIDTAYLQVQDSVSGTLNCSNYTISIAEVSDGGTLNDIILRAVASDTLQSYTLLWNTGDITEVIYNKTTGLYIVTVTYSNGCIDTAYLQIQDSVSGTLNCSNYTISIAEVSDGGTLNDITLKAVASDTLQGYTLLWNTGDTTEFIYNKTTGLYIVTVTYSNGCIDTAYLQVQDSVTSNTILCGNINANFSYSYSSNLGVNFINKSTISSNKTLNYLWFFGDGTTSSVKNPTKIYLSTGSYNVALIAKDSLNNNCVDTFFQTINISPCNSIELNFTDSVVLNTVHFKNTSILNGFTIKNVRWEFSDGSVVYYDNPIKTFNINGFASFMAYMYLDLEDSSGNKCSKVIYKKVDVSNNICDLVKPIRKVTIQNKTVIVNLQIDSSIQNVVSDFYFDNNQSILQTPNLTVTHTYNNYGYNYLAGTIIYNVGNVNCIDSFFDYININNNISCKDTNFVSSINCSGYLSPVCGCDSFTYNNSCEAFSNGVNNFIYGVCPNDTNSYAFFSGYIVVDKNSNCQKDSTDNFNFLGTIEFKNGNNIYYAYTNNYGYYEIYLPKANYSLKLINKPSYYINTCILDTISLLANSFGPYLNNNFYINNSCNYANVNIFSTNVVPGFNTTKYISKNIELISNNNLVLKYKFNSYMNFSSISGVNNYIINGNIISINVSDINSGVISVSLQTPINIPLGTPVLDSVWIENLPQNLCTNSNSSAFISNSVIGSFDPNDKLVYPNGIIDTSIKKLRYHINFQNVGSHIAKTVEIRDTLDNSLDFSTLKLLGSSHLVNMFKDDNNILSFEYPNINLIDSATNEELSKGWVEYEIGISPNATIGTKIHNTASIYFDFNIPVVTNTTENEIKLKASSGINTIDSKNYQIELFPNPTKTGFTNLFINSKTHQKLDFYIFDNLGKEVVKFETENIIGKISKKIDLNNLSKGIYYLRVDIGQSTENIKLIVE